MLRVGHLSGHTKQTESSRPKTPSCADQSRQESADKGGPILLKDLAVLFKVVNSCRRMPSRKCEHSRQRSRCKECLGRASAPTSASGASARNVGDRRSASTTASGASARSAWGRASAPASARRARPGTAGDPAYASITAKRVLEPMQRMRGSSICPHERRKSECKQCDGDRRYVDLTEKAVIGRHLMRERPRGITSAKRVPPP